MVWNVGNSSSTTNAHTESYSYSVSVSTNGSLPLVSLKDSIKFTFTHSSTATNKTGSKHFKQGTCKGHHAQARRQVVLTDPRRKKKSIPTSQENPDKTCRALPIRVCHVLRNERFHVDSPRERFESDRATTIG